VKKGEREIERIENVLLEGFRKEAKVQLDSKIDRKEVYDMIGLKADRLSHEKVQR